MSRHSSAYLLTALLLLCSWSRQAKGRPQRPHSRSLEQAGLDSGTFPFFDISVYYQMLDLRASSHSNVTGVVLLLHGMHFTSDVWLKLGTVHALGVLGYRVMAIDLPGFGKTPRLPYSDNNMRAELVMSAFDFAARTDTKVIKMLMSPSMSGRYALPFVDRYGSLLAGWAAVAPLGVRVWGGPLESAHRTVKMLAMYGATDPMLPDSDLLLKMFDRSDKVVLPDAGHACYLQDTQAFNERLARFAGECQDVVTLDSHGEQVEEE